MKKTLVALAIQIALAAAHAEPPTSLEILPGGVVQIHGGSANGCQVKPVLVDFSSGKWRGFAVRSKITPNSGTELSQVLSMQNDNKTTYDYTLATAINGGTLTAKGAWSGETPVQGFGRLDFRVPEALTSDLLVECNGKPVFSSPDKVSKAPANVPLVFRQASSGSALVPLFG